MLKNKFQNTKQEAIKLKQRYDTYLELGQTAINGFIDKLSDLQPPKFVLPPRLDTPYDQDRNGSQSYPYEDLNHPDYEQLQAQYQQALAWWQLAEFNFEQNNPDIARVYQARYNQLLKNCRRGRTTADD